MAVPRCVLIAPDKFKGSLSAAEVAGHIRAGLLRASPDLTVRLAPIADGGEGTVDAALANGFDAVAVAVTGPLGEHVTATLARRDDTAVVELAQASGLQLLSGRRRQPLAATSYGTGELIRAALDAGCTTIILGIGGSASTDGGAGMLHALGVGLHDERRRALTPTATLSEVYGVDLSNLDPRVGNTNFVLASDVGNVLLGPSGAAAVFAPQKGAGPADVVALEHSMSRWAGLITAAVGRDYSDEPGAGAAGGVGLAAMAVLGARSRPGIDLILELIGFEELLTGCDLVITGEGSLDQQSLAGKAPIGVCQAASRRGIATIAVAGRSTLSDAELADAGFAAAFTLLAIQPDLQHCIADAPELLESLAETLAKAWEAGRF